MASFSDSIKSQVEAMTVPQQKQAIKKATDTFKKGTPEYSQYKADIAQYEVESQSFFNTQRDVVVRSAEFKRSELDSQKEYSATIKDRYNAFVDTAYLSSDVAKAVNRFAIENIYSNGTEDKTFVSTNDVVTITKELARSGIAPSEYAYTLLQGAKNQGDYDFYLQTLRSDEKMKESSAYLTPFRAGIASVEGAVLTDPTMLAYAPAALFSRLQGGMRIASVVGSNAALQGSLSMMRTYGSPERTTTDLALDIAFGGIVDSYFTMKQLGRLDKLPTGNIADDAIDINDFAKLHEDSVIINKGMDNFGNKAYDLSRSDLTGYKWSNGIDEATSIELIAKKKTRDSLISIYSPSALTRSKGALSYISKIDSMLSEAGFSKSGSTYSKDGNEYTLRLNKVTRALDKSNIPTGLDDANIALDKNLFNAIEIEEIKRVKGIDGTSMSDDIIKQITKFADDNNIPLVLRRASNKGMDDKLKRLYERHGFTDDMKGVEIKNADEIPMVRMPNESKVKHKVIVAKNIASASQSYTKRTKNIDKVINSKKSKEKERKNKGAGKKAKDTAVKEEPEYSKEVKALETEKAVFHRIASVVDEIVDEAKVAIYDLVEDGLPTQLDKDNFAKELSDDLTDVLGQEVKVEIKTVKAIELDGDALLKEEMQTINTNSLGGKHKVNVSWWKKQDKYDTEDIITDQNKLATQSLQEGDFGRNMLRNLGKEVNYLYREMDFNGLLDVLTLGGTFGAKSNLFFASAKELAIGQGKNIGIMIKTKPSLNGKTNLSKPYISSAKEYIVKDSFEAIRNNLEEIIISKQYFDSLPLKDKKRLLSMAELKFVNDMDEYRGLAPEVGAIVKGKLTFKVDNGNVNIGGNAIKVGTLMAIGGSSVLMADDGSSVSMISPPFIIIALAGGIFGLRALRNAGGVKEVIRSAWNKVDSADKIARIMEKPMFKSWEAFRQTSVDKANFEIINSMQVVMNNGSELSRKIGQRLGFDAVNPQEVLNAMKSKNIMSRKWVQAFTEPEEKNFREWLKENKYNESLLDEILEGGAETKYREMFLEQVTDYNEFGKYADSKTVVAQANIMKSVIDEVKNTGMINKIIGFSEKALSKIENYIPRIANNKFIMSVVHYGGKEKLSEQFAKAITKDIEKNGKVADAELVKKMADDMIEWYSDAGGKYANKSKAEAVIRAMKRLGYDTSEIDAELLIAESKTNSDAISRGKFRIGMDFSEFEPFRVNINGVDELVTLGTLFERNANSLVKVYADQVAGAVALRRSTRGMIDGMEDGVTSESALRELIDKELNDNVKDVLHTYVDVVAGKPLYQSTHTATRIVDGLRDLAYARLALTQFAMASEYATALANMMRSKPAMEQGLTHLRNIVRRATGGESVNTAYAATVQRTLGQGSSSIRRENTLKNIDNVFNQASNTDGNTAEKVATMVKYLTLRLTNILHADDAMKTVSAIANTDYLSKWLRGDITISKNRLERFGINNRFIEMFKGGFKSDKNGNLLADWDSGWTQDMKDEYARVMDKMVMVDSPEAIASALPHVALTSDAGRLTSFMTHFTATSYSTKFLQGAKRPDVKSYSDTMIYFLGTYAGVYARHIATKQEEPDAEEVLHKAIMMMPLTAPYGIYSMVTDPMTTSMPNDIILEMSKLQDIIE